MGVFGQLMDGPARVFGLTAGKFSVTLNRRLGDDLLPLFERHRLPERVAIGGTHVVHADGRDGLQPRVDLRGTDDEAPAAANPDGPDAFPIDGRLGAEEIHGGTEVLRV